MDVDAATNLMRLAHTDSGIVTAVRGVCAARHRRLLPACSTSHDGAVRLLEATSSLATACMPPASCLLHAHAAGVSCRAQQAAGGRTVLLQRAVAARQGCCCDAQDWPQGASSIQSATSRRPCLRCASLACARQRLHSAAPSVSVQACVGVCGCLPLHCRWRPRRRRLATHTPSVLPSTTKTGWTSTTPQVTAHTQVCVLRRPWCAAALLLVHGRLMRPEQTRVTLVELCRLAGMCAACSGAAHPAGRARGGLLHQHRDR
jgi:hypothetical protein